MLIKNEKLLPCCQGAAWAALNDDAVLQASISGCEASRARRRTSWRPLWPRRSGRRACFSGKLSFAEIDAPHGYSLVFEGQAGPAGFSKGQALVWLTPQGPQQTLLAYEAQVQIGGKLAQIGTRVIDAAAQKIIGEFFSRFEAQLAPLAETAPATSAAPVPSWWGRLLAWACGQVPRPR